MARGGFGAMGGMNMNNLMKQAQKMQKKMEEAQAALAEKTVETTSGGGAVKIVITGKRVIQSIKINPEVVYRHDVVVPELLILLSVIDAVRQAGEMANNEMGKITGGVGNGMF